MFILIKLTYFFLVTLIALHSTLVGRSHAGSEFRGLRACSKSVMALQGEDTSATFASIAAYAILNWTLVHLNISTPLPQSCIMSRIYAFVTDICAFANE